ncbi:MAG TPA: M15 family metallopeptidase [Myxococcota bacterium]|nr:M15 family metallopeptidase [Myxococcota bacterium]
MITWLIACTTQAGEFVTGPAEPVVEESQPIESRPDSEAPSFASSSDPLTQDEKDAMTGVTWNEGCPVPLDDLVALRPSHWDMEGRVQTGELVVAEVRVAELETVFAALFEARFPIRSMRPARDFGGSDDASMEADNTSAFNCRTTTGGSSWSQHSYGHAIDINPVENPYVSGSLVLPPAGAAYTERDPEVPGLIVEGDVVTAAFSAIGWGWGGDWSSLKDYQHFSSTGL